MLDNRASERPPSATPSAMIHTRAVTRPRIALAAALALVAVLAAVVAAGCGGTSPAGAAGGVIVAVGAENEYANVIEQIGGRYVKVTAIESNPNTDPHTFEASPSVAEAVSAAQPADRKRRRLRHLHGKDRVGRRPGSDSQRKVINVQHLLGLPDSTPNPHLWYKPQTMPAVAKAAGQRPLGVAARARGVLPGKRQALRSIAEAVVRGDREVQGRLPEHAGRDDRAGRRLHARSCRDAEHDAVHAAGGRS